MSGKKLFHIFSIMFIFHVVFSVTLIGQKAKHIPGKILVVMDEGQEIGSLTRDLPVFSVKNAAFKIHQLPTAPLTVHAIHFDPELVDESRLLTEIRGHRDVKLAQFDHFISERVIPDDPRFNLQWQYINDGSEGGKEGADLDMELAWEVTTGGSTNNGDTIVVCIIDSGMDGSHEDFGDNLWVNYREIPGNGIDDDENGYADDYYGWSVYTLDDNIFNNNSHGTAVAGIVGAKGNNGIGVSGVNWNVKLMIIRGGGSESQALESYAYPYKMRKLYNETAGEKGAFVVATNASWGTDYLNWEDAPIWCAFYDTLGSVGILNCGATANTNVNVDLQGDMPTSCPSDYLLTVTNLSRADTKVNQAGFGLESIDLGSYGQGTYTTTNNNSYTAFGGTSGATPHVTGVVALLYSLNCDLLSDLALENPPAAALFVKDLIMNGVVPNESLKDKTVTGGRLNAMNPIAMLQNLCSGCAFPFSVQTDSIGGNTAVLSWEKSESQQSFDVLFKQADATDWDTIFNVQNQLIFDTLSYCTSYKIKMRSNCVDTTSVFSFEFTFTTDGCCVLPASYVTEVSDNTYSLVLDDVIAAEQYVLEYKKFGDKNWETALLNEPEFSLGVLDTCSLYYFRYKTICKNEEETVFSPVFLMRGECGDCEFNSLCSFGGSNSFEFIDTFFIGDFVNASGRGTKGHEIFNDVIAYTFESGKKYTIGVRPGFISSTIYKEYIKVFLDLDGDGSLTEEELMLDLVSGSGEKVEGEITIPKNITDRTTTIRVKLLYNNTTDPCLDVPFGETEDYCVALHARSDCLNGNFAIDTVFIDQEKASIIWLPVEDAQQYLFRYKKAEAAEWKYGLTYENEVLLDSLEECTDHLFELSALCLETEGDFSDPLVFKTDCGSSTFNSALDNSEIKLIPNPFFENTSLKISEPGSLRRITLLNALGQQMSSMENIISRHNGMIDLSELVAVSGLKGLVFINLSFSNGYEMTIKAIAL